MSKGISRVNFRKSAKKNIQKRDIRELLSMRKFTHVKVTFEWMYKLWKIAGLIRSQTFLTSRILHTKSVSQLVYQKSEIHSVQGFFQDVVILFCFLFIPLGIQLFFFWCFRPIPCSSLLVRILPASCYSDGQPKSSKEIPEDEWINEGILVPMPAYEQGWMLWHVDETRKHTEHMCGLQLIRN